MLDAWPQADTHAKALAIGGGASSASKERERERERVKEIMYSVFVEREKREWER